MNFIQSVETCFTKYLDFKGRASRSEYWWFVLFYTICWIVGYSLGPVIEALIILGLIIPAIAVCARRLHDINKSGWLQLLMITIIGIIPLIFWWATEGTKKNNRHGKPIKLK